MQLFSSLLSYPYRLILFVLARSKAYRNELRVSLIRLRNGLSQESHETREMLEIYARFSKGKATKEEMDTANEQLRDIIRSLGLGALLFLPFAPLTIPVLVKLGKFLGVEVLPSAFRRDQ
jgi:hypothetical protein